MNTKSDEKFLAIEATIETNKNENDEKLANITEDIQKLTTFMMDQDNISKSSPSQRNTLTPPEPTTMVQTNRRDPPLEGGKSTNIGVMWTLKHEISSPKFYELLTKTYLKGDTALDLNYFLTTSRCLSMR